MGLINGGLAFRRFKVLGELPPNFRTEFLEGIAKHAFREKMTARTADDNIGWVSIEDADDTDFDLNKVLVGHYLVLGLRIDKKRVPAKLLKIFHNRKVKETMNAKGVEKLSASQKREIKEAVHEDLLGRALPTVAVHDMAWDMDSGEIRFFCTRDTLADLFRIWFRDTFGIDITPLKPHHWLASQGLGAEALDDLLAQGAPRMFTPQVGWDG